MNPTELLKKAKEALNLAIEQKKQNQDLIRSMGPAIVDALEPALKDLAKNSKYNKDELLKALEGVAINFPEIKVPEPKISVNVPDVNVTHQVNIPEIKIPEIKYTPPRITIPDIKMPDEMNISGWVSLMGYDKGLLTNPLPVQIRDAKGNPVEVGGGSYAVGGGGGGIVTIGGALATVGVVTINPDGLPTYSTSSAGAGSSSVSLVNADGTYYNSDNPLPVSFTAAASQNVNVFDGKASSVTSHLDTTGDFRGLDIASVRTVNVVSNLNSTTATLGSGAAFTGLAEETKDFSVIQVSVFSDQASATDGLSIQQSSDGSNWDIIDTYTIAASTGKTFSFQVAARYFRIVYTNGGTIQTAFRLQAVLHQTVSKNSSQRPGDGLSNENDFEQVSAYLGALNSAGNWDRLRTASGEAVGGLRVVAATDSVQSVHIADASIPVTSFSTLGVDQVSGATWSVNVVSDAVVLDQTTDSISVRQVSGATDSVNVVNANSIDVQLVSGSVASVNVLTFNGNAPATGLNETNAGVLRVVIMSDSVASVNVVSDAVTLSDTTDTIGTLQVSGAIDSTNLISLNGTTLATGLNETNAGVMRVVQMTDSVSSVSVTNTVTVTGSLTSVVAVGDVPSDTADTGTPPIKIGGIARSTNPTAVADNDRVSQTYDDLGRIVTRPIQVRDLLATAYTTISTGTETTILTAAAAGYLDCIWMAFSNTSSVAQQIDIRAVSAGNIVHTALIPAGATVGWAPPVPWPQDATGNAWTADGADVTGSTVYITSLFSKEV